MTADGMLELIQVSKTYQGRQHPVHALDDVSIRVAPGEFVAVCGPSGCGKTSLLLTAGTLLAPSSGRVLIDSQDVYALTPDARAALCATHIGFVFQQFHLIPYLDVRENILAPTLASGCAGATNAADELIERFGLNERQSHLPGELSTGERQRTALARALLNRPSILLADEPTGNLDRDNAAIIMDHLTAFARDGGIVLLVTHDQSDSARADRTLSLEHGHLLPSS